MMSQNALSALTSSVRNLFPNQEVLVNSSLEILNWMIHAKYIKREFDQCKILAQEELKRSNNYNEYANYILGSIYRDEGEIQESLKYFKKCHLLNPKNVEYGKQIGRCLFLLGRYQLSLEMFFKTEKLSEVPDWNIYHHLGICYLKLNDEEKAKEYLKRAVSLGRSEKSLSKLAELYENKKDYVNAVETYQIASRLYPSNTSLAIGLSLVYMKLEDYKKAFDQLGSALAHDSANADALFTFAAEIQRHGEYDVAVLKYKIAAQNLPECAEMWNNIGMCFFGKRKYVAAITCLKRSFYLNPLNWLTSYNLGLLHLNTRQFASAAVFLSTAVKLNSQHGPTFTLLALSLKHLGDDLNCKLCFEEALKRNGNDIEACINYAVFLYTINAETSSQKYYSHFQHLLNLFPHIDRELIHMANSLVEKLEISNHMKKNKENVEENEYDSPTTEETKLSGRATDIENGVHESVALSRFCNFAENEFDTEDELV